MEHLKKTLLGLKIITVIDFADIVLVVLYFCFFLTLSMKRAYRGLPCVYLLPH